MSATNPFDRKIAAVLKSLSKGIKDAPIREKAGKDFHSVRSRVVDAALGQMLDDLFKSFSVPTEEYQKPAMAHAVTVVRALCDREFVSTAAFLFATWRDLIASQPFDAVLPLAPDAASFEVWLKASAQPAKEIEQRLLAAPGPTYMTAGADWLLIHLKAENLVPLLEILLTRQSRPKYLPTWSETLNSALRKDKNGVLLRVILGYPWLTEDRVRTLAEVVRLEPDLMNVTIDALPQMIADKEPPRAAVTFVRQLFANLMTTAEKERQFASALLARLGTGILLRRETGHAAIEVLEFIQETARKLRTATPDPETRSRTWLLECLKEEAAPIDGQLQITLDGALRYAIAFEKASQGFPAVDILTMTARNFGLTPIGDKTETVSYDPLQHEDMDGGMIPGDSALIESQGWLHGGNVILRAKVRNKKE